MGAGPTGGRATSNAGEAGTCPLYHEAVELIGRRWTGAIVEVLIQRRGAMRYTEIGAAVPQLSDRMLSERLRELEERGLLKRTVDGGPPVQVSYELTTMGQSLEPALHELKLWAQRWL